LTGICPLVATKAVTGGDSDVNGMITVTGNTANVAQLTAATNTLTLRPMISGAVLAPGTDGGKTVEGWRCGLAGDGTTVLPKYLPSSCRGTYP
jgi:type IV pilus assembly protein PilA